MTTSLKLVDSSSDDSGRARYALLAQALRRRIQAGEWVPGVALPSEQALAQESQVALGTMRRALQVLVDEGLIERVHGRGTFVREGLSGASMLRFFRFDAEHGSVPRSTILSARRAVPPAEVLRLLGRPPGEQALQLTRLRSIDEAPCLLETIWLPLPEFTALDGDDSSGWGDLLYPMYAQRCGVRIHRAVDSIGFGRLSAAQARRLDLAAGHPCAVVHRAAYDITGRCVEVRVTRGDANAFHYTVTLS
jgi:GntR family transcriptional regulator